MKSDDDATFRIVSVDGGGYLGLASANLIRIVEDDQGEPFHESFDFFCGTSTGALIALALAIGKSGTDLVNLYKNLGSNVFRKQRFSFGGLRRAKYSNEGLQAALEETFGDLTLDAVSARKKHVLVPAFNVTNGTPCIFKTDHSDRLRRDGQLRLVDIALASAAAPYFFPMVEIHNPRDDSSVVYCDGGVAANHPALLGYTEAVDELRIPPERLRILSISTPREDLGSPKATKLNRGLLGWGSQLASIFIDSNSELTHQVMRRLCRSEQHVTSTYQRIRLDNPGRFSMDDVSDEATKQLINLGAHKAHEPETRDALATILA